MDNNGTFKAMDYAVSSRIDSLNIGETMAHNTYYGQYELAKFSNTTGQQKNTKTNNTREIRKMNSFQASQYNSNPNNIKQNLQKRNQSNSNQHQSYNNDDQKQSDNSYVMCSLY